MALQQIGILINGFGAAYSGGSATAYLAGTTTKLTWYTDAAGTTPAANPITLDVNGRATVYLNGTTLYKLDVKNSAGVSVAGFPIDYLSGNGAYVGDTAGTHTGPVVGNVTGDVTGDVTGAVSGLALGSLVNIRYLTSGTSYTPTAGTTKAFIECIGGGGGGGGATSITAQSSASGGGGGGGYNGYLVTGIGAGPYTYAIGAGGAGGASTGANGTAGGTTQITIGAINIQATGGSGGIAMTSGTSVNQMLGGTGGIGQGNMQITIRGGEGGDSYRASGTSVIIVGNGGMSQAAPLTTGKASTIGSGSNATGYGGGGAGTWAINGNSNAGGNGSQGIIKITEYK